MILSWPEIVARYRGALADRGSEPLWSAVDAVATLAAHIAASPLSVILFGWTSMLDLAIQQTRGQPFKTPYLRVSPLSSGKVEFCYIDTIMVDRQWRKPVESAEVVGRFEAFVDQLRWRSEPTPTVLRR